MFKQKFLIYRAITLLGDLIILNAGFILALYFSRDFKEIYNGEFALKISLWVSLSWLYLGYSFKLYNANRIERFEQSVKNLFQTIVFHMLLVCALLFLIKNYKLTFEIILQAYFLFIPFDLMWRMILLNSLRKIRMASDHYRTAIIVGSGTAAVQIKNILDSHTGYGYKVMGVFDDGIPTTKNLKITGNLRAAQDFCLQHRIEDIFCVLHLSEIDKIINLISFSEKNLIRYKIVPDFTALHNKPFAIDYYGFVPVLSPKPEPLSNYINQSFKRIFDVLFSLIVIVLLLSWLIPIIGLLILIESRGPVFYRQNRSGLNYKTFKIFKFRTMKVIESDDEFIQAKKNDSRFTGIGKYLRKYNIDELPQFINVLKGNMSVVGPRPHPIKLNQEYRSIIDRYMIRHIVKPGVTGLAQSKGLRGETENQELMEKRIMADVFYIENWSFLMDIKIIFMTIMNMLNSKKNGN